MSRLIILIVVVLPQPDGTDQHADLAVGDLEAEVVHGDVTVGIALRDVLEPDHQIRG